MGVGFDGLVREKAEVEKTKCERETEIVFLKKMKEFRFKRPPLSFPNHATAVKKLIRHKTRFKSIPCSSRNQHDSNIYIYIYMAMSSARHVVA